MYTGSLAAISNKADWILQSPLVDDTGASIVLTGLEMHIYICDPDTPTVAILSGSTLDGTITLPTTTSFQVWFTPAMLAVLAAGNYVVFLTIIIAGVKSQILACELPVVEGGPS